VAANSSWLAFEPRKHVVVCLIQKTDFGVQAMSRNTSRRSAFTLVEMLVVIFIIAALAAMLIVGIGQAIKASHNYAMKMEVSQLAQAVEAYKQDKGDYFPSLSESYNTTNRGGTVAWRHIQRCYPKMTAANRDLFFNAIEADNPTTSEAMVFFLSRTGSDLQNPFGGTTDYKIYFPFDERRLVTRALPATMTLPARSYAWYKPKYAKDTAYFYFDGRKSNPALNGTMPLAGYDVFDTLAVGGPKPYGKAGTNEFLNATTFQIICAGLDGDFGSQTAAARKVLPFGTTGAHNLAEGDLDNITNFGDGKLIKDLLD
jgi:prepilin-type N-terminal cleavage/methylation domain-containing protein